MRVRRKNAFKKVELTAYKGGAQTIFVWWGWELWGGGELKEIREQPDFGKNFPKSPLLFLPPIGGADQVFLESNRKKRSKAGFIIGRGMNRDAHEKVTLEN